METDAGTLELVLTDQTLDTHLRCQIGYTGCTQEVWWLGDGFCPRCGDSPRGGRFICNECHEHIINGVAMQHKACGYSGVALDFYHVIMPI